MSDKLACYGWGGVLVAGLAVAACSQETKEPVEIGAAQVELRSDLVLQDAHRPQTSSADPEDQEGFDRTSQPISAGRPIPLPKPGTGPQNREYHAVQRYEFLPALLDKPGTQPFSGKDPAASGAVSSPSVKYRVWAGKGFGVGAEPMAQTLHIDDAHYYFPSVTGKPYAQPSEHLAPTGKPFKSQKPLIFHGGATGFAYEPPSVPAEGSPVFETMRVLSPIPETQVYFSSRPQTEVKLAPGKIRLDLMNGNENLNRHRFGKLPQPAKRRSKLSQSVMEP